MQAGGIGLDAREAMHEEGWHEARLGENADDAELPGRLARVAPQRFQVAAGPRVESDEALFDLLELLPGQSDVEAGCAELSEVQDVFPVLLGDAEDVADDGDGELRAVALDDVDDAGIPFEVVERAILEAVSLARLKHSAIDAGLFDCLVDALLDDRSFEIQETASERLYPSSCTLC